MNIETIVEAYAWVGFVLLMLITLGGGLIISAALWWKAFVTWTDWFEIFYWYAVYKRENRKKKTKRTRDEIARHVIESINDMEEVRKSKKQSNGN